MRAFRLESSSLLSGCRIAVGILILACATAAGADESRAPTSQLQQWADWERTANNSDYIKPDSTWKAKVVAVDRAEVDIDVAPHLRAVLLPRFTRGNKVLFPLHPLNGSREVPFQDREAADTWAVTPSASRSLFLWGDFPVQLKLPTDLAQPGVHQPWKAVIDKGLFTSRHRDQLIRKVDEAIGLDPTLHVLGEVMTVRDKKTGNGFIVRDLSTLKPDHYYVPAFSIPHVGRAIAERNGMSFESFWKKYDAEPYGRVKARILMRYGLRFVTPNPQNRLIEFDRNMRPTGRIVIRDLGDSQLVVPVAKALGLHKELATDVEEQESKNANPYAEHSFKRMSEAMPWEVVKEWADAHGAAYKDELETTLGIKISTVTHEEVFSREAAEKLARHLRAAKKRAVASPKKVPVLRSIRDRSRDSEREAKASRRRRQSARKVPRSRQGRGR